MVTKKVGRIICCIFAVILSLLGIGVELTTTNTSNLCTLNSIVSERVMMDAELGTPTEARIYSVNQIVQESPVCTPRMLENRVELFRRNTGNSVHRGQCREAFLVLIVGMFLQYLLGRLTQTDSYQIAESKEDGQLFLCRTAVVNYIHSKDSGE